MAFVNTLRKPSGLLIITSDSGGEQHFETQQCCHCGSYWQFVPGSGRPHRWCMNCAGPTCSDPTCIETCIPEERMLETIEKNWERLNRSWW